MSRLSIVIPTLRRADTFEYAFETVLAQTYADVEIVVQNNGNDPATRAIVERAGADRVCHFSTDDVLPMTENWERALSNATGDYVTFIGDDDGLLPDASDVAASVLDAEDAELLSWHPFLYLWPQYWEARRRNRLQALISPFEVSAYASRPLLERFYAFSAHYSKLPMIYNSFVARSLIDRVRDRHGRYFFGSLPDVNSGIVNAAYSEAFLLSSRALSVAGVSQHSTGHRWTRAAARVTSGELERDFPTLRSDEVSSGAGSNLELLIANEMTLMQERVLRDIVPLRFDEFGYVHAIAAGINLSPSRYVETLSVIHDLMRQFGIPDDAIAIPAPTEHPPAPADGVHTLGPQDVLHVVDGDREGLRSIADAVRLAATLAPSRTTMRRTVQTEPRGSVPSISDKPLLFARGSDGIGALISGWSEPESWGVWSVDRECTLRVRIPPSANGKSMRLGLRYRVIPFPDQTSRVIECAVGDSRAIWQFSRANASGELVVKIGHRPESGAVDVSFTNVNARSPRELEIGSDERRLGIGIEQIRLLPRRSRRLRA